MALFKKLLDANSVRERVRLSLLCANCFLMVGEHNLLQPLNKKDIY
jgi:hypothetical protein